MDGAVDGEHRDVQEVARAGAPTGRGDFPRGLTTELGISGISRAFSTHHLEVAPASRPAPMDSKLTAYRRHRWPVSV